MTMTDDYRCLPDEFTATPVRWPVRLYMKLTRVDETEALNCGKAVDVVPSADIVTKLKQIANRLKGSGVDVETGRVDYNQLALSDVFRECIDAAQMLRIFDPSVLDNHEERLAFWINLYNILIIHAVIAYGVKDTVNEVRGIFDRAAYIIGGYRFSANDIEHGILRANSGHVALPGPQFAEDDPRRAFCLDHLDVRVHFALVCASKSCPPIGIYQTEHISRQLDMAAQNFANAGGMELDRDTMTISLSRIFSWYASDFGGSLFGYAKRGKLLRSIAHFLISSDDRLFVEENAERLKVKFLPYDWSLNI